MKLVLLFSLAVAALGFSPSSMRVRSKTTSLLAASSFGRRDGWSDKPSYKPRSTTPVADKKVGPLQRALMDDVMIDPNYFLTWAFAILGGVIMWYHPCKSRRKTSESFFCRHQAVFSYPVSLSLSLQLPRMVLFLSLALLAVPSTFSLLLCFGCRRVVFVASLRKTALSFTTSRALT